ncbi:tetratricopeptide repeat protein [Sorangium sp. So ce367]|uniref:tetratricopeptide repeat protein n=1 Tax=Sorangium sp. So ce367 TaxID=3133305 RepID=UPI003F5DFF0D
MATAPARLDVFISCAPARADQELLQALEAHLSALGPDVSPWHRGRVTGGEELEREAASQLAAARLILLFVSADYLACGVCRTEAERALARHAAGVAHVIPLIARACSWQGASWSRLAVLPVGGRPVASWPDRDEAWAHIVDGIRAACRLVGDVTATAAIRPRAPLAHPAAQAPALPAPGSALHQLRSPPADFTGREKELADLRAKLGPGGAIVAGVTGQGGVGKTALVLKLAHDLQVRYPDAQLDIDLRGARSDPLTPAQVMAEVIHAFDPTAELPDDPEALGRVYRSVLHGKRVLLLLDNARDRAQVEPVMPPPGSLLLVTSRQHFTLPGLYARRLGTLDPGESVELVRSIAPRLDEAAAAELARLCGYLPLAIRTTASALAERVDLRPARYIERLRSIQNRRELVDAVLSESLHLLNAGVRTFWFHVGVFLGDFGVEGAAAVAGTTHDVAADALGELVQRSLVEWDGASERYRFHDLARDYARSHLDPGERFAAEGRHAEYFLQVVRAADHSHQRGETTSLDVLALLDREWGNISMTLSWAAANAEHDDAVANVCCDLLLLIPYSLRTQKPVLEQIPWYEAGLAAARKLGRRPEEGRLLAELGNACAALDDWQKAIELFERRLTIARQLGDSQGEREALGSLTHLYLRAGKERKTIEYYEQILAIARESGSRKEEGETLGNLGLIYARLGDLSKAIQCYEQAVAIARQLENREEEAVASRNLGRAYEQLGDLPRAKAAMQVSIDFERAIDQLDGG